MWSQQHRTNTDVRPTTLLRECEKGKLSSGEGRVTGAGSCAFLATTSSLKNGLGTHLRRCKQARVIYGLPEHETPSRSSSQGRQVLLASLSVKSETLVGHWPRPNSLEETRLYTNDELITISQRTSLLGNEICSLTLDFQIQLPVESLNAGAGVGVVVSEAYIE